MNHIYSEETARDDWHQHESNLRKALTIAAESAILEHSDNAEIKYILKSTAERQLEHGLSTFTVS